MTNKCVGCEIEDANFMFQCNVFDEEAEKYVDEIYCNECLSNILTDEPNILFTMEALQLD